MITLHKPFRTHIEMLVSFTNCFDINITPERTRLLLLAASISMLDHICIFDLSLFKPTIISPTYHHLLLELRILSTGHINWGELFLTMWTNVIILYNVVQLDAV